MDLEKLKEHREALKAINKEVEEKKVSYHFSKVYTRYFSSLEEDDLYYRIGLMERVVNKRNCLVRPEISLGLKDSKGLTNQERMRRGLAPVLFNDIHRPIHLHHIQQLYYGPFAELSFTEHMDNYSLLHTVDRRYISWRSDKRLTIEFNRQKGQHWRARERYINGHKFP